jgi:hypothetical protein
VDESLKDGAVLTRKIMLEPEKLTEEGLKYRLRCFLFFGLFVFTLLGVPLLTAIF